MAVQYAPSKLRVPPGFQNLLEGLAREVLREQPENIIDFAANYFKNRLAIRNETGEDDAKKGEKMEKLQQDEEIDIDLDDPATADAALKIQSVFRGKKVKKSLPEKKDPENKEPVKKEPEKKEPEKKEPEKIEQKDEEEAATKIQAGFRGHQARKSVKEMKSASEMGDGEEAERQEKGGDEKEYVTHSQEIRDFDDPKFDGAATKIQAGFRGYKAREEVKEKRSGGALKSASNEEEIAAVKIQSSFRGHQARKEVEAMKLAGSTDTVETNNVDIDAKKSEEAAVKIQSGYRGYVARKEVEAMKASKSDEKAPEHDADMEAKKSEEAAIKIQSSYRGFAARKEVEAMKAANSQDTVKSKDDEEMEKAATKIQATYRGYKTRSDMSVETPSVTKDTNENDTKAEDETKGESETKE